MVPLDLSVHEIVVVLFAMLCVAVHDRIRPQVPKLPLYLFVEKFPDNAILPSLFVNDADDCHAVVFYFAAAV